MPSAAARRLGEPKRIGVGIGHLVFATLSIFMKGMELERELTIPRGAHWFAASAASPADACGARDGWPKRQNRYIAAP